MKPEAPQPKFPCSCGDPRCNYDAYWKEHNPMPAVAAQPEPEAARLDNLLKPNAIHADEKAEPMTTAEKVRRIRSGLGLNRGAPSESVAPTLEPEGEPRTRKVESWKSFGKKRSGFTKVAPTPNREEPKYCHHCDDWHTGAHISIDHHSGESTALPDRIAPIKECNCGSHKLAPLYHAPTCPKASAAQREVAPTPQEEGMCDDDSDLHPEQPSCKNWVPKLPEVAQPTPPQVGDKPIYVPLPLNDAEKMLRSRWMGDLDRIPLGKVVEFMQSFAESEVARLTAENQRLTRELPWKLAVLAVSYFCEGETGGLKRNHTEILSKEFERELASGEPQGETK